MNGRVGCATIPYRTAGFLKLEIRVALDVTCVCGIEQGGSWAPVTEPGHRRALRQVVAASLKEGYQTKVLQSGGSCIRSDMDGNGWGRRRAEVQAGHLAELLPGGETLIYRLPKAAREGIGWQHLPKLKISTGSLKTLPSGQNGMLGTRPLGSAIFATLERSVVLASFM